MATADGLGHFFDERENLSTALVSAAACELFVTLCTKTVSLDHNSIKNIVLEAGEQSINSQLEDRYDSESSLAATAIYRQPGGVLKALLANVGDGMILIVDGMTGEIKNTVAARLWTWPNRW